MGCQLLSPRMSRMSRYWTGIGLAQSLKRLLNAARASMVRLLRPRELRFTAVRGSKYSQKLDFSLSLTHSACGSQHWLLRRGSKCRQCTQAWRSAPHPVQLSRRPIMSPGISGRAWPQLWQVRQRSGIEIGKVRVARSSA